MQPSSTVGFQDPAYHAKNKNNFVNSLRGSFRVRNRDFLNSTSSFVKYGSLSIEDGIAIVHIPAGLVVYHASRIFEMNSVFSDYPVLGYSNFRDDNRERILREVPREVRYRYPKKDNDGYHVTFFSTPSPGISYLYKDNAVVNSSFRYTAREESARRIFFQDEGIAEEEVGNRHLIVNADQRRFQEGYSVYRTTRDIRLILLTVDTIICHLDGSDTFFLENLKRKMIEELPVGAIEDIDIAMGSSTPLPILEAATAFLRLHRHPQNLFAFRRLIRSRPELLLAVPHGQLRDFLHDICIEGNDDDVIRDIELAYADVNIPYPRHSVFESDKVYFNVLEDLFRDHGIDGTISSKIFNFDGMFHGEVALFYCPDVLQRDTSNAYDIHHGPGFGGFLAEMRKYMLRPLNLCDEDNAREKRLLCHTGHLYEHSCWTYISVRKLLRYFGTTVDDSLEGPLGIAAFFHDIGKAGGCGRVQTAKQFERYPNYTVVNEEDWGVYYDYPSLDPESAVAIRCRYRDGTYLSGALPDHPMKGYRYIVGDLPFMITGLGDDEIVEVNFGQKLREYLRDHEQDPNTTLNLIAVLVACHWDIGALLYRYIDDTDMSILDDMTFSSNLAEFLGKVQFFCYAHFDVNDREMFRNVLDALVLLSTADILAQRVPFVERSEDLIDWREYPNTEYYDLEYQGSTGPTSAVTYYHKARRLLEIIENLGVLPYHYFNNYNIFHNITTDISDSEILLRMFPNDFPRVIVFDFDGTIAKGSSIRQTCQDANFVLYEPSMKSLETIQGLREKGIKIGIASRNFFPSNLRRALENQRYHGKKLGDFFDFVCSVYTGGETDPDYTAQQIRCRERLRQERTQDFFAWKNGSEWETTIVPDSPDLASKNKIFHISTIVEWYTRTMKAPLFASQIILFDDDDDFFRSQLHVRVLKAFDDVGVIDIVRSLGMVCYCTARDRYNRPLREHISNL
jgi:hypothetical protein